MKATNLEKGALSLLQKGVVIPALPLALNKERKLDERRQRALIRYYLDAGAGGVAVAVHTTQFEIRLPEVGLYEPLLEIAGEEFDRFEAQKAEPRIRIAGVIGQTAQACAEARLAKSKGYHAALLSLAAFPDASNETLLEHCRTVAEIIPLVGFYLQPAVGGRVLDVNFWRAFASIDRVIAIKIAPFDRYRTLDVLRGVAESGRSDKIALYTGNDDNILVDLLTEFRIGVGSGLKSLRIVGGLLGHWSVWTRTAVLLLDKIHSGELDNDVQKQLGLAMQITDCNAAFFDSANSFKGCIVGLHEVLRRQGLLEGNWTLNPEEKLSAGQMEEIDRIYKAYPELNDDDFVARNLGKWLT
ncbi:MAG: dihydrodipicolinate synthase family protein [Bacteroidetes bacterium]|nr:MAG: dihydrodipicolinate synthase family protein [Bacteroidota bacterium]